MRYLGLAPPPQRLDLCGRAHLSFTPSPVSLRGARERHRRRGGGPAPRRPRGVDPPPAREIHDVGDAERLATRRTTRPRLRLRRALPPPVRDAGTTERVAAAREPAVPLAVPAELAQGIVVVAWVRGRRRRRRCGGRDRRRGVALPDRPHQARARPHGQPELREVLTCQRPEAGVVDVVLSEDGEVAPQAALLDEIDHFRGALRIGCVHAAPGSPRLTNAAQAARRHHGTAGQLNCVRIYLVLKNPWESAIPYE